MALETGTYINSLTATNPTVTDPKAEGDDHIRLLKSTIKATFPNLTGAVTPTHTELSLRVGTKRTQQLTLANKTLPALIRWWMRCNWAMKRRNLAALRCE